MSEVPTDMRALSVDEVERIILETECPSLSDKDDEIWTRRMACALAMEFNDRLARPHPAPATDGESERLRVGWTFLPVEPTSAMLNAAQDACRAGAGMSWNGRSPQMLFREAYRAMLAARPAVEHDRAVEEALKQTLACLVATTSLIVRAEDIKKQPSKAVASDAMFRQMLKDYDNATIRARAVIADRQRARDGQSGGGA